MNCRMCKSSNLELFLDLGSTPPADNFLTSKQLSEPEIYYPLNVHICHDCSLIQLGYVVSPEKLYNSNYPYESSTTNTGKSHFFRMANDICNKFDLEKNSLVVDLGSNVGVLLQGFKENEMRVVGIEPSLNIVRIAIENGIETIPSFFSMDAVNEILEKHGRASILTATNVFAHIDNLDDFMNATDKLLIENGIFIFEAPYFLHLLNNLEYDTIYHEHLSYLSIKPLKLFFEKHGYEIFDIKEVTIHGGSLRVFVSRKNKQTINPIVDEMIKIENEQNIYSISTLKDFAKKVHDHRNDLLSLLHKLKSQGKKIVCVSAPAKGMTLMNYCNIDTTICDYVTEKSKMKIGKFTPGTHVPVVSDDIFHKDSPDYAVLLAWNFADEIIKNLSVFEQNGGKFIIPIPRVEIKNDS
jgi:2-polyprenyl-3-methyl-5-hydroxy-6-metoxy-1,4-benzoquinol methylase